MARKELTPEEVTELLKSPHVEKIVGGMISFTAEFKRMAYQQMAEGKLMRAIFIENGIDPKVLGDRRVWGLAEALRNRAERAEGFADLRRHNLRKPGQASKEQTLGMRVEQLEHELAYTRQEVEFLKKIRMADMEAGKSWESKQRQK